MKPTDPQRTSRRDSRRRAAQAHGGPIARAPATTTASARITSRATTTRAQRRRGARARDVDIRAVDRLAIVLTVVVVDAAAGLDCSMARARAAARDPEVSPLRGPRPRCRRRPEPALQPASAPQLLTNEPRPWRSTRDRAASALHRYGWIDEETASRACRSTRRRS